MSSVVVVGSGVGGLVAAAIMSARGHQVTVLERRPHYGGKVRDEAFGGRAISAGPSLLTQREVLERVFEEAGASLADHVELVPRQLIARHVWEDGSQLDLHVDREASAEAVARLAGSDEARRWRRFQSHVSRTWEAVSTTAQGAPRASFMSTVAHLARQGQVAAADAHRTAWRSICAQLSDPRLRQLYARYATTVGSNPMDAPATVNALIHLEHEGVYEVVGGVSRVNVALAGLIWSRGGTIRANAEVAQLHVRAGAVHAVELHDGELIACAAVIYGGAPEALGEGLLGDEVAQVAPQATERSLSALTRAMLARTSGRPLVHHNVYFGRDPVEEHADLFDEGRLARSPTVVVYAADRGDGQELSAGPERLMVQVHAPALGDLGLPSDDAVDRCWAQCWERLEAMGLQIQPERVVETHPRTWNARFPGTGGSIHGRTRHDARQALHGPGARTAVRGLYLAGGSAHPGGGVPVAALGGRLAAREVLRDVDSAVLPARAPSRASRVG